MQDNMKKMKKTLKPKNNFTRGKKLQRRGNYLYHRIIEKFVKMTKKFYFNIFLNCLDRVKFFFYKNENWNIASVKK